MRSERLGVERFGLRKVVAALFFALIFAACSGDGPGDAPGEVEATTTTAVPADAAPAPTSTTSTSTTVPPTTTTPEFVLAHDPTLDDRSVPIDFDHPIAVVDGEFLSLIHI